MLTLGAAAIHLDRVDEGMALMYSAAVELDPIVPRWERHEVHLDVLTNLIGAPWLERAAPVDHVRALPDLPDVDDAGETAAPSSGSDAEILFGALRVYLLRGHREGLPALRAAVEALRPRLSPDLAGRWGPTLVAVVRELLDDDLAAELTERLLAVARESGGPTGLRAMLVGRGITETLRGRFDLAELHHAEAHQISEVLGAPASMARRHDALLLAWRGARDALTEASALLPPRSGDATTGGAPVQLVRTAQAVLALAQGRYGEALESTRQVYDDDPVFWGRLALPDMVEAGARGGDRAAAEAALTRCVERAEACPTPWALGLLARSRALLAAGDDAEALHREGIERLGATGVVTEQARAHLLYGEWLRRRRRRTDARRELDRALRMFSAMGAVAFAERARTELVAAGASAPRPGPRRPDPLTPHERRIARLAADGATNQQIATTLFISPNTVEYHLRKVYRKVGVSSRRQLDDVIRRAAL